ncbi:MAG: hypothetical protein ABS63_04295 [Microbacterium sp. SCN 70-27]|uniref:hypothetical protein n=1 Tax=unclassified Microbacterium TaxID=2609290 RepID=UPI000869544D|nr:MULTISPECIES: hypothetical protein [unclassified Microbacterium]MBN9224429.1 hypothetical protein [Microbacterium sp.]ODT28401.1 MAG: hypothetical protein ABS63_04295 [Microbacterium sp. SCN 70-27]
MARVETSPITADDTGPAARFLHTELNSAVSVARWQALLQPSWPDAGPNRGFQLTVDGEVVGVYAAVYARRETSTGPLTTCNLAAFCVREEYRMHSLKLVRALLAQPGYVFTDFSPSGNVIAMNERLGMRTLDSTTRLIVNGPRPAPRGVRLTEDPAALGSVLRDRDAEVYRDHADASAARHLLVQRGSDYAYLVFRATSRKRLRLFAAPLYVGGDRGLLREAWGGVRSRILLRHRLPFTLAERRILGFTDGLGRALAHPRPKMVRGDVADADVDYMYSELALLAW